MSTAASSASDEIAVLERTRLRLAGVDDNQLSIVLERVLPRLLGVLSSEDAAVRSACLSCLQHINQRVRGHPSIVLPLDAIASVYEQGQGLVASTALVYIEMGWNTCSKPARSAVLDRILINVHSSPPSCVKTIINLVYRVIPDVQMSPNPTENHSLFSCWEHPSDRRWFLQAILDLLLLRPVVKSADDSPPASIDMSIAGLGLLKQKAINLLMCGAFTANELCRHALVGIADGDHTVVARAELIQRRIGRPDYSDITTLDGAIALYGHTKASMSLNKSILAALSMIPPASVRQRLSPLLKITLKAAFSDEDAVPRLVRAALEVLIRCIRDSSEVQIQQVSGLLLQSLLKGLSSWHKLDSVDAGMMRSLAYTAVSAIADRVPKVLASPAQLSTYFFRRLAAEPESVRHSVRDALSVLGTAIARQGLTSNNHREDVKGMLLSFLESHAVYVRSAALRWLNLVFPFDSAWARLQCLLRCGSEQPSEVRDEARRGLEPRIIALALQPYPSFETMLHICVDPNAIEDIRRTAPAYQRSIEFLRSCLVFEAKQRKQSLALHSKSISDELLIRYEELLFDAFHIRGSGLGELQDVSSQSFLQLVECRPDIFADRVATHRLDFVRKFVFGDREIARANLACVLGHSVVSLPENVLSELMSTLTSAASNYKDRSSSHGALLALGYVLKSGKVDQTQSVPALRVLVQTLDVKTPLIVSAACTSIGTAASSLSLCSLLGEDDVVALIAKLKKLSRASTESRLAEMAILSLGRLSLCDRDQVDNVLEAILSLANIRDEQLLFAAGEAIAMLAAAKNLATDDPYHLNCSGVASIDSKEKSSEDTIAIDAKMDLIFTRIIDELLMTGSVVSRCAGSVWLLSLVKYCGDTTKVRSSLRRLQEAFTSVLSDSRSLTQECAAKGLAMIYELGDKEDQGELIKSLLSTFTSGTRQVRTEADEAGFSSYKELCSAAAEMGQPDLVYRFMDLASHHTIWNSRRGAAFSLGSLLQTSKALMPNLDKIIPKLYRFQYDPNAKIRSTMKMLWKSLISDPTAAVDEHFTSILDELVSSLIAKEFRVRESSCVALCDLLSGRKYSQVEASLEQLYRHMFMVIDDINDAVRQAALVLAKSVVSFTERVCDIEFSSEADVKGCLGIALPLLMKEGMNSKCTEVAAISTQTLVRITKACGKFIRPHLQVMVRLLLESLSSMEPQTMAYAMFHTSSLKVTKEQIEAVRLSMARSSPVSSALEHCAGQVDAESLPGVVSSVVAVVRQGTGLTTLDGTAKFVVSLNAELGDAMAQHTSTLVKAFSSGLLDQSASLRKAYASALAHICQNAPQKTIADLIVRVQYLYMESDNEYASETAGNLVQQMAHRSQDQLQHHYANVLPLAFVASHDSRKEVADSWKQAWDDCTPGRQTGVRRHLHSILSIVSALMTSPSYQRKATGITALADVATLLEAQFGEHLEQMLPLLLDSAKGRVWAGKECALKALETVSQVAVKSIKPEFAQQIVSVLQEECNRVRDPTYQSIALKCFGSVAQTFPKLNTIDGVSSTLETLLKPVEASAVAKDAPSNEEDITEYRRVRQRLLSAGYRCLAYVFPTDDTQKPHVSWVLGCFLGGVIGRDTRVRAPALESMAVFLQRVQFSVSSSSSLSREDLTRIITTLQSCLKETKYSAVRVGAIKALVTLLKQIDAPELIESHVDALMENMFALAGDLSVEVQNNVEVAKKLLLKMKKTQEACDK